MNGFTPWKILHLDLSQEIPSLPSKPGFQGFFVVFWWRGIPLGQRWIPSEQLPIPAAELTEHALTVITPVVDRPLNTLQERFSLTLSESRGLSASVVVCTRDRPEQLRRCLSSLKNLSRKPHEILVVDNAPGSDATRRIVAQFPDIRYIREPLAGLDMARNTGIRHTNGEIVLFTDDDATVHPDWIGRIQQGFKDPKVMAVTGLVLPAELKTQSQILFETHWGFGRGYQPKTFDHRFFERTQREGTPVWEIGAGANMAFRRQAFEQMGCFDERLDVGAAGCSGDSEMWYRILAEGWTCSYEPTAVAYHYHREDTKDLNRQLFYYMRGHVTALLIQFEKYRHWGNLRRIFFSLPYYYVKLSANGILMGFPDRHSTLQAEVLGCLSGIKFYLLNRRHRSSLKAT